MGNKQFRTAEFPPHILELHKHLPKVGDIVEFDPCFQCSDMSSVRKAGPPSTAIITKLKYGAYVPESEHNNIHFIIPDADYACIVYGRVLVATSITPYCDHAHGNLIVPEGLETILRYKTDISPDTDAEGWLIKNAPTSTFFN
jgi:hypothetical protein